MRKLIFLVICLVGLIAASGCATVSNTAEGLGTGLAKDTKAIWNSLVKANNWLNEHTW